MDATRDNKTGKVNEILGELREVLSGRFSVIDTIFPAVLFIVINKLVGFNTALWCSLTINITTAVYRLVKRQTMTYTIVGLIAVIMATVFTKLSGKATGLFLPGILTGVVTIIVALVSVIIHKPMVAYTSFIVRRWPIQWYWHPKIRPAYDEVTWFWVFFFTLRLFGDYVLFQNGNPNIYAIYDLLSGWPATIVLLVVSYLYGLWRLQHLGGPSVEEFKLKLQPPWQSQRRGF